MASANNGAMTVSPLAAKRLVLVFSLLFAPAMAWAQDRAQALLQFDVGGASAGGIVAVILANIVAFFLIRLIGKNLER